MTKFIEETREFMKQTHQDEASNIKKCKWHCFDIPFLLVCGDIETATKIFNSVKDKSNECKAVLQFAVTKS